VVLLVIDSGGGRIDHAEKIVDLIIEYKDLTFIAYVQKALSAAATITLACEKIFVTEAATIGGAVSYSLDEKGKVEALPAEVAEKFQSIWRAVCRKAAQHGGHPSLIAEAMVDPAFALTMRGTGEGAELERNGEGKVLKAKGRILTLTAREAVSCELAVGLVQDVGAIGQQLAVADWQAIGGQERAEAAAFDVPDVLGPEAFATPSALYSFLYRKVVSLGLTSEQTEIQQNKALRDWKKWFDEQRLSGHSVKWGMRLRDASTRRMVLIPQQALSLWEEEWSVSSGGLGFGSLMSPLIDSESLLMGPARDRVFITADFCEMVLSNYKSRGHQAGTNINEPRKDPHYQEIDRKMVFLEGPLQDTKVYPLKVTAKCDNEPRVFPIAWVGKRSKAKLLKVGPNSELTLSGEVGKVVPYLFTDGLFVIEVLLDKCELPGVSGEDEPPSNGGKTKENEQTLDGEKAKEDEYASDGGKAKVDDQTSDRQKPDECRGWLQMAKNFLHAGRPKMAIMYAEKVLAKSPDSEYADEAQAIRDKARQTLDKPSEPGDAKSGP
jgi:hypothetical protein